MDIQDGGCGISHYQLLQHNHRDRDYLTDEEIEEYKSKVTEAVDYCFITKNTDIESYFINAQHLCNVYGEALTMEMAETMINTATVSAEEKSIDKFIDYRFIKHKPELNKGILKPAELARKCNTQYKENAKLKRRLWIN